MTGRYRSFWLRYWQRPDGGDRITIEHVQTGSTSLQLSLAAAAAWIDGQIRCPDQERPRSVDAQEK